MAAYNWISFEAECPVCHQVGNFVGQTYAAFSYDGDAAGRFFDFLYKIGQRMRWWPKTDRRYKKWRETNLVNSPENEAQDICEDDILVECKNCGAELQAFAVFKELTPIEIKRIEHIR